MISQRMITLGLGVIALLSPVITGASGSQSGKTSPQASIDRGYEVDQKVSDYSAALSADGSSDTEYNQTGFGAFYPRPATGMHRSQRKHTLPADTMLRTSEYKKNNDRVRKSDLSYRKQLRKTKKDSTLKKFWKDYGILFKAAGVGAGGVAGVYAGMDLAKVGVENIDGGNTFQGRPMDFTLRDGDVHFNDGGIIIAVLMGLGIAVGLCVIVNELLNLELFNTGAFIKALMLFFTFCGSGAFFAGLNFIDTTTELSTAISNGFSGGAISVDTVVENGMEHSSGLCQILLITGSALLGSILVGLVWLSCINGREFNQNKANGYMDQK